MSKKVLFLDTLGRTILGVLNEKETTKEKLAVINPAVLNIVPTQQGTMQVQIIPMVFREILADREEDVTWYYKRNFVTECSEGTSLSTQIIAQYDNVTSATPVQPAPAAPQASPQTQAAPEAIKLFDED